MLEGKGVGEGANRIGHVCLLPHLGALSVTGRSPLFLWDRRTFQHSCVTGTLRPLDVYLAPSPSPCSFCFLRGCKGRIHTYSGHKLCNHPFTSSVRVRRRGQPVLEYVSSCLIPFSPWRVLIMLTDTYLSSVNARERKIYDVEHGVGNPNAEA